MKKCKATKVNGTGCSRDAAKQGDFCWQHQLVSRTSKQRFSAMIVIGLILGLLGFLADIDQLTPRIVALFASTPSPRIAEVPEARKNPSGMSSEMIVRYGDLNGDGVLDVFDLTVLSQHLRGSPLLPLPMRACADVNRDSVTDEDDAVTLIHMIVGTIPSV